MATGISSSGDYIYKPVAKRAGWGKVLDVGCGQGVILSRLKSEGRELYGFDIAPAAVRLAKTMNTDRNFFAADAQNMPLKSNTFDCIVCTELIEHIEGDRAVRECYRVLKPNGVALFTAPNKSGAGNGYQAAHVHSFTFKSFASFLEQAGFEVICGYKLGLYIPILSHLLEVASLALRRNLPLAGPLNIEVPEFLATNFLIECRKPPI
ncbi:class I SAM-dependent methyltransferase [Chloroflexota bacterium]